MTKSVTIQKVPGTVQPAIRHRVINRVVVAINRAVAVPAQHVHAPHRRRGPSHLAARNRQGSPRHPASARPSRRGAVGDALALLLGRHVVRRSALRLGVGSGGGGATAGCGGGRDVVGRGWRLMRERRLRGPGFCAACWFLHQWDIPFRLGNILRARSACSERRPPMHGVSRAAMVF